MSKVLSISIAAYNVENYIRQCLDSFLIPDILDDIEVLVIDDGSSDQTREIVTIYQQKYPESIRLVAKENGGHGSTVNRGIEEATGTYFKPVDGDDWVAQEGFIELVNYLKTSNADLVSTDFYQVEHNTGKIMGIEKKQFSGIEYGKEYDFSEVCSQVYINMHCAAFRTELLKQMPDRLDEHCFYVDAEFILYPIPYVKRIAFLEKPVYMYRLGMTTQSMNIKSMQKNCGNHERVYESLLNFYESEAVASAKPAIRHYIEGGIARILTSQHKIYLSFPKSPAYKKKIMDLDIAAKHAYPSIYGAVTNPAVKLLRHSGYRLYGLAAWLCQRKYKN
nr:glycosyltransferase family 2 protein [Eubacterium sp.]